MCGAGFKRHKINVKSMKSYKKKLESEGPDEGFEIKKEKNERETEYEKGLHKSVGMEKGFKGQ